MQISGIDDDDDKSTTMTMTRQRRRKITTNSGSPPSNKVKLRPGKILAFSLSAGSRLSGS